MSDDVKSLSREELNAFETDCDLRIWERGVGSRRVLRDGEQMMVNVGQYRSLLATARQAVSQPPAAPSGTVGEEDVERFVYGFSTGGIKEDLSHEWLFTRDAVKEGLEDFLSRHPHVPAAVAVPSPEREQQDEPFCGVCDAPRHFTYGVCDGCGHPKSPSVSSPPTQQQEKP